MYPSWINLLIAFRNKSDPKTLLEGSVIYFNSVIYFLYISEYSDIGPGMHSLYKYNALKIKIVKYISLHGPKSYVVGLTSGYITLIQTHTIFLLHPLLSSLRHVNDNTSHSASLYSDA